MNGSSLKKIPDKMKKKRAYVNEIAPLRVKGVFPHDSQNGDSFEQINTVDSFLCRQFYASRFVTVCIQCALVFITI